MGKINSKAKGSFEVWRRLSGEFSDYSVSNFGRVRSVDRYIGCKEGRKLLFLSKVLFQSKDDRGYLQVQLQINKRRRSVKVHRLVAIAFLGPRNGLTVDHIDGNKENNHLSNLELVTNRENNLRARKKGLIKPPIGKSTPKKINFEIAQLIRELVENGMKRRIIADSFNIHIATVGEIIRNEIWKEKN